MGNIELEYDNICNVKYCAESTKSKSVSSVIMSFTDIGISWDRMVPDVPLMLPVAINYTVTS